MLLTLIQEPVFAALKIVGDVQNVLHGRSEDSFDDLDPTQYQLALGSGSFFSERDLGEAMILKGNPYVTPPYEATLLHTFEGSHSFSTSFIMGIEKGELPSSLYHLKEPEVPVTLEELYLELSVSYPLGFAVFGWVEFERAHATRLKKPPVFHEKVNDLRSLYWTLDEQFLSQNGYFFGIVLPQAAMGAYPSHQIGRGFYKNPIERKVSSFQSHTHLALANGELRFLTKFEEMPDLSSITGVRHLANHSTLEKGSFVLFALNQIIAH